MLESHMALAESSTSCSYQNPSLLLALQTLTSDTSFTQTRQSEQNTAGGKIGSRSPQKFKFVEASDAYSGLHYSSHRPASRI